MKYQNYQFQDFMMDEDFQKWVLEPDSHADPLGPDWALLPPDKEEEILKARTALLELHLAGVRKERGVRQQVPVAVREAADVQQALWSRIALAIEAGDRDAAPGNAAMPTARLIPLWRQTWVRAAAAVLLVMGVGWLLWLRAKSAAGEVVAYQTAFGQIRRITLPDRSVIYLNANSHLSFARNWDTSQDREVSLTGEAFFAVQPQRQPRKFKVRLAGAQVEVLGTEFTVTNRPSLTRVVLNQGQVKVGLGDERQPPQSALMRPGDLVEIDRRKNRLTKTRVARPENYSAFVQHVIEFNDAPLSEVARVLRDHYGYKVTFQPAALAQKRFTSSNPDNRVDLLLFAIEKSFNLQISRKGKHITIQDAGR